MKPSMRIQFGQIAGMAFGSVWAHKFRSGLTILGIVIGITTVVSVASILSGLRQGIVDFFQEFGPDNIFVARYSGDPSGSQARPKELKRRPITPDYAAYIQKLSLSVEDVGVSVFLSPPPGRLFVAKVRGLESDNLSVVGVTPNLLTITPRELLRGRVFTQEEANRAQRVCIIGSSLAGALFPAEDPAGKSMMLDGAEFTIAGVFAPAKGSFFGENGQDRQVTIPLQTARLRYPQAQNFFLTVHARPGLRNDAIEETRAALRKIRGAAPGSEDDFAVSTADSIIQQLDRIIGMIILVSTAISALGLLVGGIGVMNIMLVSVTERTREIGVRKALGARRRDIILQFLTEAIALTGAGGLIGVALSAVIATLLSLALPALRGGVPLWAVVTGFSVSVAVGVFFGVWPAMKAARLDPVDALRYE
jgi:putative ABC transport system permease protein